MATVRITIILVKNENIFILKVTLWFGIQYKVIMSMENLLETQHVCELLSCVEVLCG